MVIVLSPVTGIYVNKKSEKNFFVEISTLNFITVKHS